MDLFLCQIPGTVFRQGHALIFGWAEKTFTLGDNYILDIVFLNIFEGFQNLLQLKIFADPKFLSTLPLIHAVPSLGLQIITS